MTSRILLRLSGEYDVPIRPLTLPDASAPPEQQAEAEAVRLFVDRAQAAAPTFALTADNARAVAAICQRLDGLPLALESGGGEGPAPAAQALLPRLARTLPLLDERSPGRPGPSTDNAATPSPGATTSCRPNAKPSFIT